MICLKFFLVCVIFTVSVSGSEEEDIPYPIPKKLNLTAYEMYTTVDLLIEISIRPCKEVSRPKMGSIKKFIYEMLASAPKRNGQTSHARFMESYVSLVNCLTLVEEIYQKTPKNLGNPFLENPKVSEATTNYDFEDTTHQNFDNPNVRHPLRPTMKLPPRARRDVGAVKDEESNFINSRRFSSAEQEVDMVDYDKSFNLFFYYMFSITQKVCPITWEAFSRDFILPALEETAEWIEKDRKMHKSALQKYFENGNVMQDLQLCNAKLEGNVNKMDYYDSDGDRN